MNEICERLRDEAALEGRASDELKEHAASCPGCSAFLSNLTALSGELAGLRHRDASHELVEKLLARPELKPRTNVRFRTWAVALASAAGLLLVVRITIRPDVRSLRTSTPAEPMAQGERADVPRRNEEFQRQEGLAFPVEEDKLLAKTEQAYEFREEEFQEKEELGKKDAPALEGRIGTGILLDERFAPAKRASREPVYPQAARDEHVQGTVVLEVTVDRAGNVVGIRVVHSIPLLDRAAIEAVREWKYEPADSDAPRVFRVSVPFTLEEPQDDEDRSRVDGRLTFEQAKGYWANTYLPGDPMVRNLEHRLRGAAHPPIHSGALPASLPFDATSTGALSIFLHADRKGLSEKSRLLVQVGIRAAVQQARRRPPMNVGIVLDLPRPVSPEVATATRALLESLESSQELGDRFRLIVTGAGEVLTPETFRRGPLTVALDDLYAHGASGSVSDALARALEKVHAGDDPTMPLGTSLVLLVAGRSFGGELGTLSRLSQTSALGGVSVSVVGVGGNGDELDALALAGQGRRYELDQATEAGSVVDRELSSASRTVARAIRLRIQLAEGVRLVGVLGSERLDARASERVRAEERAIDLRLARNLGVEADRGKDEDGIQIVIPAFYAGDAHSILLDVVAEGPGPIAEVTARYKDLVRLGNAVSRASLGLPRSDAAPGPLQTVVENDYRELRVAEALEAASEAMGRGETGTASRTLQSALRFARERDRFLLEEYLRFFPQLPSDYLRDSLLYASALKRTHSAT